MHQVLLYMKKLKILCTSLVDAMKILTIYHLWKCQCLFFHIKNADILIRLSFYCRWNPLSDEWTDSIPMPTARYGHGSICLHGKIYVVGGETISSVLYSMDAFDIQKGIWETKAPTNHVHRDFGVHNLHIKKLNNQL